MKNKITPPMLIISIGFVLLISTVVAVIFKPEFVDFLAVSLIAVPILMLLYAVFDWTSRAGGETQ